MQEILEKYFDYLKSEKRFSAHTLRNYRIDLDSFFEFLKSQFDKDISPLVLEKVNAQNLRTYISYRMMDDALRVSISRNLSGIRSFYKWLNKNKIIHNPALEALNFKVPKEKPKQFADSDEAQNVIKLSYKQDHHEEWVKHRDLALMILLFSTGMRISEAINLNIEDLPSSDFMTITGKGKKSRIIPILPIVKEALDEYLIVHPFSGNKKAPLFVGARLKRLNAGVIQNQLNKIKRDCGITCKINPHAFRHAFATSLLKKDGDLRTIQELLGHSSISTTQKYTDIDLEHIQKVYNKAHPRK
ncbi:MAG: Tyrosine recombinase XerC [Alphaproteobacteria bacterium ADurb.Bin438]|nr:MAG: Tyrosine recombinase XerC [Alphaproteobacteria bacterium ADurb.Bin438]